MAESIVADVLINLLNSGKSVLTSGEFAEVLKKVEEEHASKQDKKYSF